MTSPVTPILNKGQNEAIGFKSNWANSFLVDFICVFCIFFLYAGNSVPAINEPHYWTKAAHFWDNNFGKGDLFLESGDAHWLFFATFGYLTQCTPTHWAVWTGRFVTWIFLALGWTMLGRSLWQGEEKTDRQPPIPLQASCWGLVWLSGLHYGHWAGEWVVGGCESKGIAYAFIFAGLAFAIRRRWTLAWAMLGGASAYHVVTGIWVIASVATVSLLLDGYSIRRWFTTHAPGWSLCVIGVLIGVVPALAIDWGTDPVLASESAVKQVYTRLGHHLAPSRFSTVRWQDFGILLACACVLLWMASRSKWDGRPNDNSKTGVFASLPRGLRLIIGWSLFGFAVAMVGLFVDYLFGRAFPAQASKLLRFYLFRWNDVAMPMMVGALAVSFAFGRLRFTPYTFASRCVVGACAFIPGIVLLGYRFESNSNELIPAGDKAHFVAKSDSDAEQLRQFKDWVRVCDWIKTNSEPGSLWLTPRRQQSFKWRAGRAELACWKDAPQNAEAVVQWSKRLADAYQFDSEKKLQPWTDEKLWALHAKYGIRYVLLDRRVQGQIPPLLPILYPSQNELNATFAVFEFPSQKENVSR